MEDKKIKCIDCHKDFIFTAGEQEFFEERGYSTPIRCKDCRIKRKAEKRSSDFRR
jgi:DNA-directed RNA polymerase subunit RPC12/RpoP